MLSGGAVKGVACHNGALKKRDVRLGTCVQRMHKFIGYRCKIVHCSKCFSQRNKLRDPRISLELVLGEETEDELYKNKQFFFVSFLLWLPGRVCYSLVGQLLWAHKQVDSREASPCPKEGNLHSLVRVPETVQNTSTDNPSDTKQTKLHHCLTNVPIF